LINDTGAGFQNDVARPEQRMMSQADFAWYELVTTDMAAAQSLEAFGDGPHTMPRHRSLLCSFFNAR
jgi:hypothetical protein